MPFSSLDMSANVSKILDVSNPDLKELAENVLRESLSKTLEETSTVDELWEVFREYLVNYYYLLFIDHINESVRKNIYSAILRNEYTSLRRAAVVEIIEKERNELREVAIDWIKSELESEDGIIELREAVEARLAEELRPDVEEMLKQELMDDPDFIEMAKQELKKSILGL